ncbi:uncharacterized protein [Aegilops tauschii subsp. strangulata]|uniref:uncharacterized protein n=1 Tax=Aegilops tauschii subsp. strangulata TaxID=200361 RepID=UPI003CC88209
MYMSAELAKHMRWHKEGERSYPAGVIGHPSDAEAWKDFDREFPEFAKDARNVRLVIATDGLNPFKFGGSQYSCWPVFVSPLNLPPALCMSEENIFLTMVIPGPQHPGKNINVFMRPLVDELLQLWAGVDTYDSVTKEPFRMKVAYLFSVHDYPAYGMFAGWCTHGGLACAVCMDDVDTTWLPNGHKYSWFDCHRRFLRPDHPFRMQENAFIKRTKVLEPPPRRLTGEEVDARINHLKSQSFEGYGTTHNWTHIPVLWELPYFKKLLIRHNIDVMHNEKNVAEAIWNTVLDNDKTKDNTKARLDQALLCKRKNLNLVPKPNDKWEKPRAPYCLTRAQVREIMRWFLDLKFPDGYAANLRRGASLDQLKINGLKSHDFHIIMERLLPAMLRGFIDEDVWNVLAEVSFFYRSLCGKEVDPDKMLQWEENIAVLLCKLEKIFPPGFFNSMEHLMVHPPYEARVGGPIQYRWMYRYERCKL